MQESDGPKVRLMFQDEAGFGRINKPKYCWSIKGQRPSVPCHHIREYRYVYGAILHRFRSSLRSRNPGSGCETAEHTGIHIQGTFSGFPVACEIYCRTGQRPS